MEKDIYLVYIGNVNKKHHGNIDISMILNMSTLLTSVTVLYEGCILKTGEFSAFWDPGAAGMMVRLPSQKTQTHQTGKS